MANINYTQPNKLEDFSVWCSKKYPLWCKSNFPFIEDTFEALDTYGLICKIVQYLNETKQNLNTTEDNVQNIYDFVSNYFDNLDVQNEINKKIDSMVSSGELQTLLANQYNELREETTIRLNAQDSEINNMNNKILSVASGSPSGVYDTLEELNQANPPHDKIYVVKEDGEWYYWDSSINQWNNGGVYQSTVLVTDKTLSVEGEPADAKITGNYIENINEYYIETEKRKYYKEDFEPDNYYATKALYLFTDSIPINSIIKNIKFKASTQTTGKIGIFKMNVLDKSITLIQNIDIEISAGDNNININYLNKEDNVFIGFYGNNYYVQYQITPYKRIYQYDQDTLLYINEFSAQMGFEINIINGNKEEKTENNELLNNYKTELSKNYNNNINDYNGRND